MPQNTIVFLGGPRGVGKITVFAEVKKLLKPGEILGFVDPIILFDKFSVTGKIESLRIERMIANSLKLLKDKITFVNWGYAVWTENGYIPLIGWNLMDELARWPDIDNFVLIALDTDPSLILARRQRKKYHDQRSLDIKQIDKERAMSHRFLRCQIDTLARYGKSVKSLVVLNQEDQPQDVAKEIWNFVSEIKT